MDFLDLAKRRYSVRTYRETLVEKEKVARILEAARVSPSAANLQPTRLVVVDDKAGKSSAVRQMSTARLSPSSCARITRKPGSAQLTARALLTSMRQSPPTT